MVPAAADRLLPFGVAAWLAAVAAGLAARKRYDATPDPTPPAAAPSEPATGRWAVSATSGTVVVTDPVGRVAFRGGPTRGRGRAGDAPVFGCPLSAPADRPEDAARCPP